MDDAVTVSAVKEWLKACKPIALVAYDVEILAAIHATGGDSPEQLGEYLVARALTVPADRQLLVDSAEVLERSHSIHAQAIQTHAQSDSQTVEKWLRIFLHEHSFGLALSESIKRVWHDKQKFERSSVPADAASQKEEDQEISRQQIEECLLAACCFCQYHEDIRNLFRVLVDSGEVLQLVAAERPRTPKSHTRKRRRSESQDEDDSIATSTAARPPSKTARHSEEEAGTAASPSRSSRAVDSVQLSQPPPDLQDMASPFAMSQAPPQLVIGEYSAYVTAVEATYSGVRSCRQVCFAWCNVYQAFIAALQVVCAARSKAHEQLTLLEREVMPSLQARLLLAEEEHEAALAAVHSAAAQVASQEQDMGDQSTDIIDLSGSQSPLRGPEAASVPGDVNSHLLLLAEALGDDSRDAATLAAARAAIDERRQAKQHQANIEAQLKSCAYQQAYMGSLQQFCLALLHSLTTHRDYLRRVLASCMDAAVRFTGEQLQTALAGLQAYCEGEVQRGARMIEDQQLALEALQRHDEVYGDGASTKRDTLQSVVIEIGSARDALEQQVAEAAQPLVGAVAHMRAACPAATCEQWSSQLDTFTKAFMEKHHCSSEYGGGEGVCRLVAEALQGALAELRAEGPPGGADERIAAYPSVQLAPHVPLHRHPSEAAVQTPEAAGHPGFGPRTPLPTAPPGQDAAPCAQPPSPPDNDEDEDADLVSSNADGEGGEQALPAAAVGDGNAEADAGSAATGEQGAEQSGSSCLVM